MGFLPSDSRLESSAMAHHCSKPRTPATPEESSVPFGTTWSESSDSGNPVAIRIR